MANLERGAKYGLSGASLGAGIGSAIPGVGTAIGAGLGLLGGGLYGLFSDDPEEPQVPGLDADRLRASNAALADTLEARIRGDAPSPAELQLRAGMDRQRAMAESLAHSGAGAYNPGLARRQALRAQGEAGAAFNADAGILRAQEQAAAESRLAALLGQDKGMHFGKDMARYQQESADERNMLGGGFETGGNLLALGMKKGGGGGMTPPGGMPEGFDPSLPRTFSYNPTAAVPWAQYYTPPAAPPRVFRDPLTTGAAYADGGIVTEPTRALMGEAGPEAVVPITGPAEAALLSRMIGHARQKMAAEDRARALGALAVKLTSTDRPAQLKAAGDMGGRLGALAARLTGGATPVVGR